MSHAKPQPPAAEPKYDPSRPFPNVELLYKKPIANCPGMTIVALRVSFPPNGSTPPHTHAGAFLVGNVTSGYTLDKMNDGPMVIHGPGDTFSENPGCRHRINNNASATEPAVVVATLILETEVVEKVGIKGLVVIDEEYRAMVEEAQAGKN
ncbi:related to cupin domain protein [Rhynchosporium secalis]|uniref:Related to cupin domain protein n=1 Tax=Rhynchosporium secalis TaxID=38038 RepID=A0A1E1MGH2_RHYSE|nr:related to cupin domain protein [Rhynchosporium secalis]